MAKQSHSERAKKCRVTLDVAIAACLISVEFVQVGERTLKVPLSFLLMYWTAVLRGGIDPLPSVRGGQFNAAPPQPLIEQIIALATIASKSSRAPNCDGLVSSLFIWQSSLRAITKPIHA